jgi:sigma-B regulation protein RsbU (phosphoserine phosphatase)
MRYANAGHPKPLHVRRNDNRIEPLANASGKGQPALGLFREALYQSSEIRLEPKDLIMLFTDGLYEVQGPRDELYSQTQLVAGIRRRIHLPAPQLFDELIEEVRQFSAGSGFTDDVCLVGMETV